MNYSQDRNLPQGYFKKSQFKNAFTFASTAVTKAGGGGWVRNNRIILISVLPTTQFQSQISFDMQLLYVSSSKALPCMTQRLLTVQTYLVIA